MHSLKKLQTEKKDINLPWILIDGNALAYAALYTMGHLSYNGVPTGVIYGFLRKILTIAKKFQTNKFIFCWDAQKTYRQKDYKGYKIKREKKRKEMTDEEKEIRISFINQIQKLNQKILPNMGFRNNHVIYGYEGDDLLAIFAKKLERFKSRTIMVTTDTDMYQCLDLCDIWSPTKKKFFTAKHLKIGFGINPDQWAYAKAIGGCSTDNIIGIKGVSDPKNASSKAIQYILGNIKKGVIYDRIISEEGQEIINHNLPIVTVPYKSEKMECKLILRRDKCTLRKFIKVFDKYHFLSFLDEDLKQWKKIFIKN